MNEIDKIAHQILMKKDKTYRYCHIVFMICAGYIIIMSLIWIGHFLIYLPYLSTIDNSTKLNVSASVAAYYIPYEDKIVILSNDTTSTHYKKSMVHELCHQQQEHQHRLFIKNKVRLFFNEVECYFKEETLWWLQ